MRTAGRDGGHASQSGGPVRQIAEIRLCTGNSHSDGEFASSSVIDTEAGDASDARSMATYAVDSTADRYRPVGRAVTRNGGTPQGRTQPPGRRR